MDFRLGVANGNKPYILEVKPLPGFNPGMSDLCVQAQAMGWTHDELVNVILTEAMWHDLTWRYTSASHSRLEHKTWISTRKQRNVMKLENVSKKHLNDMEIKVIGLIEIMRRSKLSDDPVFETLRQFEKELGDVRRKRFEETTPEYKGY